MRVLKIRPIRADSIRDGRSRPREDLMLATPLLLAFALGLLVPVGSRIGGRGEGGTVLAVTLTVLAVIAGLALLG
jgi:hypothetical protein